MRIHKVVKDSRDNKITIYGCNRWQMVRGIYRTNADEVENFVMHYGREYALGDFVSVHRSFSAVPAWMKEFDGYCNDSFFSGVLIKLSDCGESAKVFTFVS